MFDIRIPCANCPFRRGQGRFFRMSERRLRDIAATTAFQCHRTLEHGRDGLVAGDRPQQCAGAIAVLHRSGMPSQIMQVASRLGEIDPADFDPRGEAHATLDDVIAEHARDDATEDHPC